MGGVKEEIIAAVRKYVDLNSKNMTFQKILMHQKQLLQVVDSFLNTS